MIALDTNFLIYADTPSDPFGRHEKANALIAELSLQAGCIPLQVLGEFMNVCRHKKVLDLDIAASRVQAYARVFEAPQTRLDDLVAAAILLKSFNLQYFDALILTVARRAGATLLLSEDMHDGLEVDGIKVVNPFNPANEVLLAKGIG